MTDIDTKTFWRTLGERAIGVSIVTAQGTDGPAGFFALSATHVTADPPTMLVSIGDRTSALKAVLHSRHFAVNYLPAEAEHVAHVFGGKSELKGADRFKAEDWGTLYSGAPVFRNAIGIIDCALENTFRHGSTTIMLGRVVGLRNGDGPALVYFRGRYHTLGSRGD